MSFEQCCVFEQNSDLLSLRGEYMHIHLYIHIYNYILYI